MKEFKITDIRKNWDKFINNLTETKKSFVTIGVHSTAEPYPSGESVAEVAITHEFGTRKIPQRSFFRSTLSAKEREIKELIDKFSIAISKESSIVKKYLSKIGFYIMSQIKSTIRTRGENANVDWPELYYIRENLPKEKWPKPHSKPLIDSGRLLKSITYEVHE